MESSAEIDCSGIAVVISQIFILGASSLSHAIRSLPWFTRIILNRHILAIPGLCFNQKKNNERKTVQLILRRSQRRRTDIIIIWHDTLNHSLTQHRSNNFTQVSPERLRKILLSFGKQIQGVVHCTREGAPDIWDHIKTLRTQGFQIANIVRETLPKQKSNDPEILTEYLQLHQKPLYELRTLAAVKRVNGELNRFAQKKKKLSKARREKSLRDQKNTKSK